MHLLCDDLIQNPILLLQKFFAHPLEISKILEKMCISLLFLHTFELWKIELSRFLKLSFPQI